MTCAPRLEGFWSRGARASLESSATKQYMSTNEIPLPFFGPIGSSLQVSLKTLMPSSATPSAPSPRPRRSPHRCAPVRGRRCGRRPPRPGVLGPGARVRRTPRTPQRPRYRKTRRPQRSCTRRGQRPRGRVARLALELPIFEAKRVESRGVQSGFIAERILDLLLDRLHDDFEAFEVG